MTIDAAIKLIIGMAVACFIFCLSLVALHTGNVVSQEVIEQILINGLILLAVVFVGNFIL